MSFHAVDLGLCCLLIEQVATVEGIDKYNQNTGITRGSVIAKCRLFLIYKSLRYFESIGLSV